MNYWFAVYKIAHAGILINNKLPNEKFPAYDTWDGWVEIINHYYFFNNIKEEKFQKAGFFTLKECEKYIETNFLEVYREAIFNF